MMRIFLLFISIFAISGSLSGQQDTTSRLHSEAEVAIHSTGEDGTLYDTLIGGVVIIQDSLYISCDNAYIQNDEDADARGNVVIAQNDSVIIYAHQADYSAKSREAQASGEVILVNGDQRLNTPKLDYNMLEKVARYSQGGTLIDGRSTLISQEGDYDTQTGIAHLRYGVSYQDSTVSLRTDSVIFDYTTRRIKIIAPTIITIDSTTIYCESGLYSLENEQGVLSENVQISTGGRIIEAGVVEVDSKRKYYKMLINPSITDDESTAKGDTIIYNAATEELYLKGNASYVSDDNDIAAQEIYYNKRTGVYETKGDAIMSEGDLSIQAEDVSSPEEGVSVATGGVELRDTAVGVTIWTDTLTSYSTDSLSLAYAEDGAAQPLMVYEMSQGDSLYLLSDTLALRRYASSDELNGDNHVQLMTGDVTGLAEQLQYHTADSVITLTERPVLWTDSTQLSADSIFLYLKDGALSRLEMVGGAFIVQLTPEGHYNQINGNRIDGDMNGGKIQSANVTSNAQMVYYVVDEGKLIGVSKTFAVSMLFTFDNGGSISEIQYEKPQSKYHDGSEGGIDTDSFLLEGFEWRGEEQPQKDIFMQRIKKKVIK